MTRPLRHSHHNRQQGFTLVEIMVAVAISLFLLAGILQVMSSNKQTSRYQEAVARIQENARFALMFLGRDFRQAGYMGCTGNDFKNQLNLDDDDKDSFFNLKNAVAGWEASTTSNGDNSTSPGDNFTTTNNTGSLSDWTDSNGNNLAADFSGLTSPLLEGSDVVIVKYAQETPSGVTSDGNTAASAASITLTGASGIVQDTIVLVADCISADLFRQAPAAIADTLSRGVTSNDPGNLPGETWSHKYTGSMIIMEMVSNVYFIATGSYGGPSLWRANFNTGPMSPPQELVEGVESMQVLYGEDMNADGMAERYVTMDAVTNISNIVSVRVSLLMRSIEEVKTISAANTKIINGVNVTGQSDRNLRYVVTSTYKIRNRGVL